MMAGAAFTQLRMRALRPELCIYAQQRRVVVTRSGCSAGVGVGVSLHKSSF